MAIDLTGIISINEYYTHHYLNTILEEDIKDIIKQLKEMLFYPLYRILKH